MLKIVAFCCGKDLGKLLLYLNFAAREGKHTIEKVTFLPQTT